MVSVHLGYVAGDFHTLLDGELFLPAETWHNNRARCRAAGIPADVVYRPKWKIALEQVRRALGNGVRFSWLTFDAGYGGKPAFRRELAALGQSAAADTSRRYRSALSAGRCRRRCCIATTPGTKPVRRARRRGVGRAACRG